MKKWTVKLICCGRDGGVFYADTWEEADEFRDSYTSGYAVKGPDSNWGHERAGIIIKTILTSGE